MNNLNVIDTDYIRSSRTIETIIVSNDLVSKVLFVYNYEGYSFRVFDSHIKLINFFINQNENFEHFENEDDLDFFLANINLTN